MLIKVFGKLDCKDCEWQKKAMRAVFNPDQWTFINAEDNGPGTLEANQYDLRLFPAIVVFDDNNNVIMIKDGKISPNDIKKEVNYISRK